MDRKAITDGSAAGDSSANGTKSKEAALDKLRKMEWMRNKQDSWHLARSNSRVDSEVHERKKYNKDEDNYFEGTGVQKTKKLRRPRTSEGSPPVPPGFLVNHVPATPPQVNAWTQKKGSALFQKDEDIDEDDQVLKLVLQESLRTAEEDKKRYLEKLRMTNLDVPSSMRTFSGGNDWEGKNNKKEVFVTSPNSKGLNKDSSKSDRDFVDTDLEEIHQKPPSSKMTTSPREKLSSLSEDDDFDESEEENESLIYHKESFKDGSSIVARETYNNDNYEPSYPHSKYSKPMVNNATHKTAASQPSYVTTDSNKSTVKRSLMRDDTVIADKLSASFNSALSFGDTQNQREEVQKTYKQTGAIQHFSSGQPGYLSNDSEENDQVKSTVSSDPSETDIMLHNFIRHDPPSTNINSYTDQSTCGAFSVEKLESNSMFPLASPHSYMSQNVNNRHPFIPCGIVDSEKHLLNGLSVVNVQPNVVHIPNEQDSSSSLSGSPLQILTPYGSLEKTYTPVQTPPQSGHMPYALPLGVENSREGCFNSHLQALKFMNQNMTQTNAEYSPISPNMRNVVPLNPQMSIPHYRNMAVPQFHGQDTQNIPSQLLHNQVQQAQLQQTQIPSDYFQNIMSLNTVQLQQVQPTTGPSESDENTKKEQGNVNNQLQPNNQLQFNTQQLFAQNQPQLLMQAQPHVMQIQNQPQVIRSMETTMPKQEELMQTNILQSTMTPCGNSTKEELFIKYQKTLQLLNQLQQEMHQVQTQPHPQPSNISLSQPQGPWGVYSGNSVMPIGVSPFYPNVAVVPHLLIEGSHITGHLSPSIVHQPNLSGIMNIAPEMNQGSEIDSDQEPGQTSSELNIGRGRGRL